MEEVFSKKSPLALKSRTKRFPCAGANYGISRRKKADFSYGAAVGLVPLWGEIFTEVEALKTLARVSAFVIGKGGIHGAEGSTTLLVEGPGKEVLKIDQIYQQVKGAGLSGEPRNLIPCQRGSLSCKNHIGCLYKKGLRK